MFADSMPPAGCLAAAAAPTCKLTGISPLTADLLRAHWHSMEYLGHLSLFYVSEMTDNL